MFKRRGSKPRTAVPPDLGRRHFLEVLPMAVSGAVLADTVAAQARQSRTAGECREARVPMKNVEGKVAFITGGSSGIGLGIARAFLESRMKVVIGYRTKAHADEALQSLASAGRNVHAIRVDVTDRAQMLKAAAEVERVFGRVHVLVNNAGVYVDTPLRTTTDEVWDWLLNVNLHGVFNGIRAFLPRIQAHGDGGHVIAISSIGGLIGGGSYSASKFAVVGMMESLRAELVDTNIGVSVCCPGVVRSNILNSSRNRPQDRATASFEPDPISKRKYQEVIDDPGLAEDPMNVGRLVLRGMRRDDLFILTHPEYADILRERGDVLLASIPNDVRVSERRIAGARTLLENSIYRRERERKGCI